MFLVFDWWLDIIWLKSHRNATYCIDFNIVIRILNTPVSAKMAQGQRKWRAVLEIFPNEVKAVDEIVMQCHSMACAAKVLAYFSRNAHNSSSSFNQLHTSTLAVLIQLYETRLIRESTVTV